MRKLYLVRHGQTLFNLRGKTQGWCDSPLTDLGIEQAKITRRFFEENNIRIDEVYSSTSERAIDTANIITDLPIHPRKGLKEWNFGKMEGEPEDLQKVPRLPGQMTHGISLCLLGEKVIDKLMIDSQKRLMILFQLRLLQIFLLWLMEGYYGCIIYPRRRSVRQKIASILEIVVS